MRGRFDAIFMFIKFGEDPISSLDFSFIGGVPLRLPVVIKATPPKNSINLFSLLGF